MSAPYRPGQPQWPENNPQRPDRPPPIQFRAEEPPRARNKALEWTLRIVGLVAVAVVSGLAWYYLTKDTPGDSGGGGTGDQQTEGVYVFTAHESMPRAETVYACPEHAYGTTGTFLANNKCDRLTRQLYVTEVDGRTVYTSVSVVTMADEAAAGELRALTDTNGSGNVSDVVRDGIVAIEGLDSLAESGGYESNLNGRDVTIVESAFDPKDAGSDEKADEQLLDEICEDALRLGTALVDTSG